MEQTNESNNELTSNELAQFLDEIENDDVEFEESTEDSIRRIQYEEMLDDDVIPEEMMSDRAWGNQMVALRDDNGVLLRNEKNGWYIIEKQQKLYTELREKWQRCSVKALETRRRKSLDIKMRKLEIRKEAINSNFIKIYEEFTVEYKRELIDVLTAEYRRVIEKSEKYINKRIAKLLSFYIPRMLRWSYARWPESFITHPGFMYIASKEYGEGKMIWVNPKIPYYFAQGHETDVLRENEPNSLYKIDKAVIQFHFNKTMLAKREVYYAVRLKDIKTFYQLVQKNPYWYDTLIQHLRKKYEESFGVGSI